MNTLTKKEFAELLDVSLQTINKAIKDGWLDDAIIKDKIIINKAVWKLSNKVGTRGKLYDGVQKLLKEYPKPIIKEPPLIKEEPITVETITDEERELREIFLDEEKAKNVIVEEKYWAKTEKKYKAKLSEIKLKEERGLYYKKENIDSTIFKAFRLLRDNLGNIPERISAELSITSSQTECKKIVKDELEFVLNDLVEELKKWEK
jgi:hypothetical protein